MFLVTRLVRPWQTGLVPPPYLTPPFANAAGAASRSLLPHCRPDDAAGAPPPCCTFLGGFCWADMARGAPVNNAKRRDSRNGTTAPPHLFERPVPECGGV